MKQDCEYKSPEISEYGSVESITENQGSNKVGTSSDEYTNQTGLTGSITGTNGKTGTL